MSPPAKSPLDSPSMRRALSQSLLPECRETRATSAAARSREASPVLQESSRLQILDDRSKKVPSGKPTARTTASGRANNPNRTAVQAGTKSAKNKNSSTATRTFTALARQSLKDSSGGGSSTTRTPAQKSVLSEDLALLSTTKGPRLPKGNASKVERPSAWELLRSAREEIRSRQVFGEVGSHYAWCGGDIGAADYEQQDPEQHEYDLALADHYRDRRPSEAVHPLAAASAALPSRTAFPDRSLRLREGLAANRTLMFEAHDDDGADWTKTEWSENEECQCDVCEPFAAPPAGNPSHLVQYNKTFRGAGDFSPRTLEWQDPLPQNLNSTQVAPVFVHKAEATIVPEKEEREFVKSLCPRAKPPEKISPGAGHFMKHRSMSVDSLPAAGQFNVNVREELMTHRGKGRQLFQPSSKDSPMRSGMHFILDPQEGDPPIPTGICGSRKFRGMCRSYSVDVIRQYLDSNDSVFRYARTDRKPGRCRQPHYQANCAGLESKELVRIRNKEHLLGPRKLATTARLNNDSRCVSTVIDQEHVGRMDAMAMKERKCQDKGFRNLCKETSRQAKQQRKFMETMRNSGGQRRSSGVASQLIWQE